MILHTHQLKQQQQLPETFRQNSIVLLHTRQQLLLAGNIKAAYLLGKGYGILRVSLDFKRSKNTKFGDPCPFVCAPKKLTSTRADQQPRTASARRSVNHQNPQKITQLRNFERGSVDRPGNIVYTQDIIALAGSAARLYPPSAAHNLQPHAISTSDPMDDAEVQAV